VEIRDRAVEVPLAMRNDFHASVIKVSLKVRRALLERIDGLLLGEIGNHPEAELLIFQAGLEIGNQGFEKVFLGVVEVTEVRAPRHAADDVDPRISERRFHSSRDLRIFVTMSSIVSRLKFGAPRKTVHSTS